ncbi:hypothetical protein RhiirA5_423141 [Rhizophagus irregularis]|uniref:Uncharacterized protein n=1 Tax=Rhizophagus irregularis TaxID=588596 RepID=A0A2I1FEV4_9GLOM|nr:hypothetical protein RhiirA5_423141 [Rhizophagus irregularis]PKC53780.1 hypothetical protein RhiirA1_478581 [Rhizophagus irregularis]PKY32847.1 hypothetical protein RhiirB3_451307 [Rhizophagus irregularis]CAB5188883.1 unnamed protein product [Rhizophagus irregularis]CAB5356866.1 unnamed protein product [Rhizophagus irregularis]
MKEIIKLKLSKHEIKKLYKNYNQKYEVELILSKYCKTDDDKYEYLESLLESLLLSDEPIVTSKLRIRDVFSEGLKYHYFLPLVLIGISTGSIFTVLYNQMVVEKKNANLLNETRTDLNIK